MPRRPRVYIPHMPYHVVQRGNNRDACYFDIENYQFYLELLKECLPRYGVLLHAYVLMTNHIHLLLTPEHEDGISRLMQVVGSRYGFYLNKKYKRSGTVWEGRHKSSLVDSENYLLKCYRYIELNPVTANMVESPEEYRWSSYHSNGLGMESDLITTHHQYDVLGQNIEERCFNYRELFKVHLSGHDVHTIQTAMHYCQPTGNVRFKESIERQIGRSFGYSKRGRPGKTAID